MPNLLAKDHWGDSFDGPSWVPFNLWMIAEHYDGLPQRCAWTLIYGQARRPHDKAKTPGATQALWANLIKEFGRIDSMAVDLPHRCAESLARWEATPKLSPREYADSREELAHHAHRLARELEIFVARIRQPLDGPLDGHDGPMNFTQFLTEEEQMRLENWVCSFKANDRSHLWFGLAGPEAVIPDMPTLLRRVGDFFQEEGQRPPVDKPQLVNAQRNQFIDDLISYFTISYRDAPPAIIADITSLFFEQGVTNNDVSQRKKRHPAVLRQASETRDEI